MNHWVIHLSLLAVLLLTGCGSSPEAFVPVTGVEKVSLPVRVERTREQVVAHVLSSARLSNLPPLSEWQVDEAQTVENEYRFRSGDWLMLIRYAGLDTENQKVLIFHQVDRLAWFGYVTPEGHVVDTSFGR